jgi:hypothetical protein
LISIHGAVPYLAGHGAIISAALGFGVFKYLVTEIFVKDHLVIKRAGAIIYFFTRYGTYKQYEYNRIKELFHYSGWLNTKRI